MTDDTHDADPTAVPGPPPAATRLSGMRGRVSDLAVLALLVAVAMSTFRTVFTGSAVLVAAAIGIVGGLAIAAASARWRWSALIVAAVAAVGYLLLGPLALGGAPTPEAVAETARAATLSWKRLLTVNPPVEGSSELLAVPFITAYLAGLVGGLLVLRTRRPAWAIAPAAAALLTGILFGTADTVAPAIVGVVFLLVVVVWLGLRGAGGEAAVRRARSRPARILAAVGMIALAGVAATTAAPALVADEQRQMLRNHVTPPLDTRDLVSPLIGFRNYQKDFRDASLLTVDGLEPGTRLRIAALDEYDGVIYTVAADRGGDSGVFERPAQAVNRSTGGLPAGPSAQLDITVGDLTGVWLPGLARGTGIDLAGPRAESLRQGLFLNPASGTAIATAGLAEGDRYRVAGAAAVTASDEKIGAADVAAVVLPAPASTPDSVGTLAAEWTADSVTALEKARALEQTLHKEGYYSNGLDGQVASRAGHSANRIGTLLGSEQMIGDEEQYAVAMALMARSLGLPARVVVGFVPPAGYTGEQSLSVTGTMASAWVEIPFEGVGWVGFDPTPDRDRIPQQLAPKPKNSPKPKTVQPPPPNQQNVELLTSMTPDDSDTRRNPMAWLWGLIMSYAALLGKTSAILLLLLIPLALIMALKARRTKARRALADPRERVAAGWDDLLDLMVDLGYARSPGTTRREAAAALAESHPHLAVLPLAEGADAGVFAPGALATEQADAYWQEVDRARGEIRLGERPARWWRSRISLRSFISEDQTRSAHGLVGRAGALWSAVRAKVRPSSERTWTR